MAYVRNIIKVGIAKTPKGFRTVFVKNSSVKDDTNGNVINITDTSFVIDYGETFVYYNVALDKCLGSRELINDSNFVLLIRIQEDKYSEGDMCNATNKQLLALSRNLERRMQLKYDRYLAAEIESIKSHTCG